MSAADAAPTHPGTRERWLGGGLVAALLGLYYWLYFLPPRSLGQHDPDRYYHLGLSKLIAAQGLLRSLPQAEDLGWGRYFPDKEFLFHVLTGAAQWLGGPNAVLALVPALGIAILLVAYTELSRRLRPLVAAVLVVAVTVLTAAFLFRLTLLRPHVLAILCFTLLLVAILRGRPKLTALAAAAFALSYHAFYVVALVAGIAWLLRNGEGFRGKHLWAWCMAGLAAGIVLNPYFPSNLGMGWLTLRLALGIDPVPMAEQGLELASYSWQKLLLAYGFLPASLLYTAVAWRLRRPPASEGRTLLAFLFLVTACFWLLGTRSPRAMEYAVPACLLMVGYAGWLLKPRAWLATHLALLVLLQGYVAFVYFRDNLKPPLTAWNDYAPLLKHIPKVDGGLKVFHCEWEIGSYIFYERPDLRFVVLLEPALLWDASREKHMAMQGLRRGAFEDPHLVLRGMFNADYVLCAAPPLIRQMDARPQDFTSPPGTKDDAIRLFAVRPGD